MNKLLVVCGPTATGKTALAAKLAKKFNGELVSADSRQVYKGMDIITGKDRPVGVKIHLLDVVEPNEEFSISYYYRLAWKEIKRIWKEEKLPILVGGTGFYIKGVIDGIESLGVPPDWELRKKLSNLEIEKLREKLKELDPGRWEKMNESDRKNPRRLIRAIEIARKIKNLIHQPAEKIKDILIIGLKADYKTLYQRIDQRVEERVRQGAEDEARKLLDKGYTWGSSALGETIGYKEWQPFFEKRVTREEVIQRWKFAEHGYARRQMTWFKKNKRINWFDISQKNWQDKVENLVKTWRYGQRKSS